jgi:hypothetical protein
MGVIRKRDGFTGMYAGLLPRLAGLGIAQRVEEEFDKFWPEEERKDEEIDGGTDDDDDDDVTRLIECIKRLSAKRLVVVLATQPLHVMAVRAMAQFVGRENKYNGILAPIKDVFHENGILGKTRFAAMKTLDSVNLSLCRFLVWLGSPRPRRRLPRCTHVQPDVRREQVRNRGQGAAQVHGPRRRVYHLLPRLSLQRRIQLHGHLEVRNSGHSFIFIWVFFDRGSL